MTAYTQITFSTPEMRVKYAEAMVEVRAEEIARIIRRLDDCDGIHTIDRLLDAANDLADEVDELGNARCEAAL